MKKEISSVTVLQMFGAIKDTVRKGVHTVGEEEALLLQIQKNCDWIKSQKEDA